MSGTAGRLATHALASLWFAGLAILITYPLIRSLDTHVPGSGAGDNLAFVWNFWWARYVLSGSGPDSGACSWASSPTTAGGTMTRP